MQGFQMYEGVLEDAFVPSSAAAALSCSDTSSSHVLLYSLSVMKEKVQQLQSIVSILALSPGPMIPPEPAAETIAAAGALIQDITVAASSMMYVLEKMAAVGADGRPCIRNEDILQNYEDCDVEAADHLVLQYNLEGGKEGALISNGGVSSPAEKFRSKDFEDVIELEAADLLAKYTHFCQVCGKGFKRDANLRMHMRAHGDEYKTIEALTNPSKKSADEVDDQSSGAVSRRKYSCPQEGCRWNRRHPNFQPLKSMVCVKNHYRRSHCPKMYVCNRCNRKQFSVLSDLRTHEKHCGDQLRWRCSCGTSFSRKDKLMGHVSLFAGHAPAMYYSNKKV